MKRGILLGLGILSLAACGSDDAKAPQTDATGAEAAPASDINANITLPDLSVETFDRHMTVLASDEFEGRAPATKGGEKTRAYLIDEMKKIGLLPANGESYEQPVGLVEQTLIPAASSLSLTMPDGETWPLDLGPETVFWSKQIKEDIAFEDSELVFVGFGVVAPEYGWNDYEGLDVTDKTVVMLVNDPGFYLEGEEFNGRAMTYYGRWTYKYEEAARQGAAGAIVIHQTDPAAYGWGVVEGGWSGPQLDLERPDGGLSRVEMEGWISEETARELFNRAGMEYDEAKQQALSPDFEAVPMGGITATATLKNVINRNQSANVAGILKGTKYPDDFLLYMAHWDHLGKSFSAIGGGDGSDDTINNGAVDNATGTAGILAIAESFANAEVAPERSIIFVAVTAEESGLLGSAYFAEDPLVPFRNIVGGINIDALTPSGPTNDLIVVGYGSSELEDILQGVADGYGKYLRPDASPENGYFYRSDHISLAKKGIPMLYVDKGIDLVDGGEEAGRALEADYTQNRYHKPADNYSADWELSGLVETMQILRDTGKEIAYSDVRPNWYEGNEFRALRDAQLAE